MLNQSIVGSGTTIICLIVIYWIIAAVSSSSSGLNEIEAAVKKSDLNNMYGMGIWIFIYAIWLVSIFLTAQSDFTNENDMLVIPESHEIQDSTAAIAKTSVTTGAATKRVRWDPSTHGPGS